MLNEFLLHTTYFGAVLSLAFYMLGMLLKRKLKSAIFNPLLISSILTIAFLLIFRIDNATYQVGAKYISYFLTPATVCLALPLYEQFELLKKNALAVVVGIASGVLSSIGSVFLLSLLFGFSHEEYVTFLPKSITTAIGMGVSEELGGYVSITVAVIIITGIIGNIFGGLVFKLLRIREPIAKGIALGSASHAIGTAKAMELGEVEGAMSSLSIVVSGLLTVAVVSFFANLI